MNTLCLYGKSSFAYRIIKTSILRVIELANLDLQLREIQDTSKLVQQSIKKIPAVRIEDEVYYLEDDNADLFAQEMTLRILRSQNYGNLRRIVVAVDYSRPIEHSLIYAKALTRLMRSMITAVNTYDPGTMDEAHRPASQLRKLGTLESERLKKHVISYNDNWIGNLRTDLPIEPIFKFGSATNTLAQITNSTDNSILILNYDGESQTFDGLAHEDLTQIQRPIIFLSDEVALSAPKNILYYTPNDLNLVDFINSTQALFNPPLDADDKLDANLPVRNCWVSSDDDITTEVHMDKDDLSKKELNSLVEFCHTSMVNLLVLSKGKMQDTKSLIAQLEDFKLAQIPILLV